MKKILTLLFAAGAITAAQAQTSKDEARRIILGDGNGSNNGGYGNGRDVILGGGNNNGNNYPGTYPSGNNNRQYRVDQINREYDGKVQSIRNNPYLSYDEKERAIRQLERDRQKRLNEAYNQYGNNNGNNRNNGDCDDNRGNNGKHKGWDKKQKNDNWRRGR